MTMPRRTPQKPSTGVGNSGRPSIPWRSYFQVHSFQGQPIPEWRQLHEIQTGEVHPIHRQLRRQPVDAEQLGPPGWTLPWPLPWSPANDERSGEAALPGVHKGLQEGHHGLHGAPRPNPWESPAPRWDVDPGIWRPYSLEARGGRQRRQLAVLPVKGDPSGRPRVWLL